MDGPNLLKEKGIKIRGVTEVTAENIQHCKNILKVGNFGSYYDGIRTNFGIMD